ncbi:flagellar biosynthesis protein FliZ [Pradoshia eiseniae]|uniref:Flagellar biosynthesis protein FliZ n=1 Tax=Pradoshia eiseniae TaxID=2064768 RepID=A0A2S7N1F8_9BACI|nr:flagellar biosynthetic protein FliO [Pradoshia eiseniae]PQD95856.1 flagellar biosynthesis protein FliZ [Pradoshia eiseniae]
MLQHMRGCQKAASLIILSLLLLLLAGAPAAAETDAGNKSVDEYYQNKESSELERTDEAEQDGLKQEGAPRDMVGITALDVFKMIFALLFVVILLFVLLKLVNKKSRGYSTGKMIQNLGGASLGGNRSLQVVRVGEKILVLGVGENVQLLDLVEEEKEFNRLIDEYNDKMGLEPSHPLIVSKLAGSGKEKRKDGPLSFASQLLAQLDEMASERKALKEKLRKRGSARDE